MKFADWSPIAKDVEIKVFNAAARRTGRAVIKALQGFAIVSLMRERTPFDAQGHRGACPT